MSAKKPKTAPAAEEQEQQVTAAAETQVQLTPDVVAEQEQATPAATEEPERPPVVKYRVNSETGLNIRPEPNRLKPALRVLPYEAVVEVQGDAVVVKGVTWLPVEEGWCIASYLTQISEEA